MQPESTLLMDGEIRPLMLNNVLEMDWFDTFLHFY